MRKKNDIKIEISLVILIALCMLMLINVSNTKINEVLAGNNSILLRENPDKQIEKLLAKEMSTYQIEACTLMEIYDGNFELIGRVPFVDGHDHSHIQGGIKNHERLKAIFKKYPEGHTRIEIGDKEQDIYFRWTTKNSTGEDRFVLFYVARPVVKNLWVIPFLCYLILILIFTLVVRLRMSCQRDRINYYHNSSMRVQSRMLNKN